jgi:hypothetical protein
VAPLVLLVWMVWRSDGRRSELSAPLMGWGGSLGNGFSTGISLPVAPNGLAACMAEYRCSAEITLRVKIVP